MGHRARRLQSERDRLGLFPARSRAIAGVSLERGRDPRYQRSPPAHLLRPGALERQRPHPQGALLRPDELRGQSRRRRQGVLVLSRCDADALLPEGPLQVSAGGIPVRASARREPAAWHGGAGVRADRHRHLRRRPLLRRVRRVRQGLARGHSGRDRRLQSRSGARHAGPAPDDLVPQHLVLGRLAAPEPRRGRCGTHPRRGFGVRTAHAPLPTGRRAAVHRERHEHRASLRLTERDAARQGRLSRIPDRRTARRGPSREARHEGGGLAADRGSRRWRSQDASPLRPRESRRRATRSAGASTWR